MSETTTEAYDPAGDTADGVNAYLDETTDDERLRVLRAEQDGKARKSVLEGPWGYLLTGGTPEPDPGGYDRRELPVDGTAYES